MKNTSKRILVIIYLLIVIIITFYLIIFKHNGKKIVIIDNKIKSFKKYSLLIVKKNDKIKVNDKIIYYNFYTNKRKILEGKIKEIIKEDNIKTYLLSNKRFVSEDHFISNVNNIIEIPIIGLFFVFLTSIYGYFIFIFIPVISIFLYQFRRLL